MFITFSAKKLLVCTCILTVCGIMVSSYFIYYPTKQATTDNTSTDFIKWVDFNVTYNALSDTMKLDIKTYGTKEHINWVDALSYLACKNGNNFSKYKTKDLSELQSKLDSGQTIDSITENMKYFSYYKESIGAVIGGFLGEYSVQTESQSGDFVWEKKYGLKAFSPVAKDFGFNHYDDFANSRSYGYKRKHTGHDLFGSIGTPVIAIESGTVECVGWNQYGGWRIGIRSFDKKRYYYYAHLRKDHPYTPLMQEGATVKAGDVIGYLGMTGYSTKENVNNINVPHLHMGMQLIFDESQKEGSTEIWIDDYEIVKFLQKNKSAVYKDEQQKEYIRKYDFYETALEVSP